MKSSNQNSALDRMISLAGALFLSACAHPSVMDLDATTIQVSANTGLICGAEGAQRVTTKLAAIETIKHGFDSYVILGSQAGTTQQYAGMTPLVANSNGTGTATIFGNTGTFQGQSTTTYTGGTPIIVNRHQQALQVKMFRTGDPQAANALIARRMLGPDWSKLVAKGSVATCAE